LQALWPIQFQRFVRSIQQLLLCRATPPRK
jgi:hypothetical protein